MTHLAVNRVSALAEDDSGRLLVAGTDANGGFASRFQLTLDPFYETRFAIEFWNSGLNHYFMIADPIEEDLIRRGSAGPGWVVMGGSRLSFLQQPLRAKRQQPALYPQPGCL